MKKINKTKKPLLERFQELAGIKPLYETGKLNNFGSTNEQLGADPDCFACINNSIDIVPLSQITYPNNNITMCGAAAGGTTYYVDEAAMNNQLVSVGSGSCGSTGTGGTGTGTGTGTGGGGSCISSSFSGQNTYTFQPAAEAIMNAPASYTWQNNTINQFITFNCNKLANRYYHFNDQVNSGNFQGNQLARKTAKRDALLLSNNTCCSSLADG